MAAKCSILLKRTGAPIAYINDQRSILEFKQEAKEGKEEIGSKT